MIRRGHLLKVCICSLLNTNKANNTESTNEVSIYGINHIVDIFGNQRIEPSNSKKYFVTVAIEGHPQIVEVDSGAGFTLLLRKEFQKLNLNIKPHKSIIAFRSYTQNVFLPDGEIEVEVRYKGKISREKMYIVPDNLTSLLGRTWIRHLSINLQKSIKKRELVSISLRFKQSIILKTLLINFLKFLRKRLCTRVYGFASITGKWKTCFPQGKRSTLCITRKSRKRT